MNFKKLGETNLQAPPIIFGGNVFGLTVKTNLVKEHQMKNGFRLLDKKTLLS